MGRTTKQTDNIAERQPYYFVPATLPNGSGGDKHCDSLYYIGDFVSGDCFAGKKIVFRFCLSKGAFIFRNTTREGKNSFN
jgi:hypothetical protein